MAMLIAEDLLLLVLDDDKGTLTTAHPQPALGGALLVELALTDAVHVEEKTSVWRSAKVQAVPGARPDDDVLGTAYDAVAERPRTAQDLVDRLGKGLKDRLAERLVDRGLLEREEGRVLGLFPRTRWPAADSTHEQQLRSSLSAALVQGLTPDERTGALVALLHAIDKAHKVVDRDRLPAREVRKRAKSIAEGEWAAKAVRDAINASTAAVAAMTASTAAAAGAASS
ncbi:GPP34 family phosphoprotein [Nocardioides sp. YIM 152315]|uniref:GOLPH3/VPS74 family protein n=1 Tax=Nocardioides sp. YIM 152315 TaxID=3031760 RepID=UPI0023D9A5E4|nr:GPP34 family phosphoprotein [Nocardioides sp. YIM 152315]MDF1606384.1 GPP34 family phosphoprotein [Nocardioides sp. YIM 152315]